MVKVNTKGMYMCTKTLMNFFFFLVITITKIIEIRVIVHTKTQKIIQINQKLTVILKYNKS